MQSTTRSRRQLEPFADRAQDAGVGLVVDEEVDVGELEAGGGGRLDASTRAIRSTAWRKVSWPCIADDRRRSRVATIRSAVGAVGAEHDRADAAALGAAQDDGAGAVGEDGGGAAVLGVGHRGVIRSAPITSTLAARPDSIWPQATASAGDEAGAGGVDVDGAGAGGAERGGDPGRGAGHQLVVGGRRDERPGRASAAAMPASASASARRRVGGELGEPSRRAAAKRRSSDPGALHDPVLVDPEPRGDLGVGDDGRGHGDAEAGDLGAGAGAATAAASASGGGSARLRHAAASGSARERASTPSRVRRTRPVRTSPGPVSRKASAPAARIAPQRLLPAHRLGSAPRRARRGRRRRGRRRSRRRRDARAAVNSISAERRARTAPPRRGHQRRVEGAGDRQADRLERRRRAAWRARLADRLGVAGEDDLAGGVVVGDGEAEARRRARAPPRPRRRATASMPPGRAAEASSIRRPRTTASRSPASASRAPPATSAGSSPSEWPASIAPRRAAGLLPVGEAGAVERRLGEVGALADLLEGVERRVRPAPARAGRGAARR